MDRIDVNTQLDNIADWYSEVLEKEEKKALLTAIRLTSRETYQQMIFQKKTLAKYDGESRERAEAFNAGVMAVLNVFNSCFEEDEVDNEN